MKSVKYIIFRRLTTADFFNINKPTGTEDSGGGQSYIDIPITAVPLEVWKEFFEEISYEDAHNGPKWDFIINSIGIGQEQELTISQRRPASVSIRSQKITSRESNRVKAWHPHNGFPRPRDPSQREHVDNLVVFIVKTFDGEYWAGWFQSTDPVKTPEDAEALREMLNRGNSTGYIKFEESAIYIDSSDKDHPFTASSGKVTESSSSRASVKRSSTSRSSGSWKKRKHKERSEEDILKDLFEEDEEESLSGEDADRIVSSTRKRNTKAAKTIKELYKGKCQITGDRLSFIKRDGTLYSEVHHLIPLGEGGADSPYNIITVSPLIHRMLHYADVSEIDLSKIEDGRLTITINGVGHIITWHLKHVELIESFID